MTMLVFLNSLLFVGSLPMMRSMPLCIHLQALHVMGVLDVGRNIFTTFLYTLVLVFERFGHLLVSLLNTLVNRIGHHLYQAVGSKAGGSGYLQQSFRTAGKPADVAAEPLGTETEALADGRIDVHGGGKVSHRGFHAQMPGQPR